MKHCFLYCFEGNFKLEQLFANYELVLGLSQWEILFLRVSHYLILYLMN